MNNHIVETTEKVDHISQEGKMVAKSNYEYIRELEYENNRLKYLLMECRQVPLKIREAASCGHYVDVFNLTYQLENKINLFMEETNAIKHGSEHLG